MNAIKKARKLISDDPASDVSRTLARLVLSLETDDAFPLGSLYELDLKAFDLALEILSEWRIDRYYAGKVKLFDLSYQVERMALS